MPVRPKDSAVEAVAFADAIAAQRWRAADARVVLSAWKDSGLTMRAFASLHGTPRKRLERWSCKLRKLDASRGEEPLRFLPVEIDTPAAPEDTRPSDAMELTLASGARITLRAGFDAAALKRLLGVVGC